jgi:hypothetical protein
VVIEVEKVFLTEFTSMSYPEYFDISIYWFLKRRVFLFFNLYINKWTNFLITFGESWQRETMSWIFLHKSADKGDLFLVDVYSKVWRLFFSSHFLIRICKIRVWWLAIFILMIFSVFRLRQKLNFYYVFLKK